jgi:hypothetical protein
VNNERVGIDAAALLVKQLACASDAPTACGFGLMQHATANVLEEPTRFRGKDLKSGLAGKEAREHRLRLPPGVRLALIEAFQGFDDQAADGHQGESMSSLGLERRREVALVKAFNDKAAACRSVTGGFQFTVAGNGDSLSKLCGFGFCHG